MTWHKYRLIHTYFDFKSVNLMDSVVFGGQGAYMVYIAYVYLHVAAV